MNVGIVPYVSTITIHLLMFSFFIYHSPHTTRTTSYVILQIWSHDYYTLGIAPPRTLRVLSKVDTNPLISCSQSMYFINLEANGYVAVFDFFWKDIPSPLWIGVAITSSVRPGVPIICNVEYHKVCNTYKLVFHLYFF